MTTTFRSIEILVLRAGRAELTRALKKFCCKPQVAAFLGALARIAAKSVGKQFFGAKGNEQE